LIVSLFTETLSVVRQIIELFDLFNSVVDLTHISLVNSCLVAELLSPNVNLASQNLILCLKIIVFGQGRFQFIFKKLDFMLVLSHLGSCWSDSFEELLLFGKLFSQFFLLVTQDHHMPKFKRWTVTAVIRWDSNLNLCRLK
jgi:hypothetical protein